MGDFSVQRHYWRQVAESEGFDIEDVSIPYGTITGLMPYDCKRCNSYPCSVLVNLYAQVGLHQMNFFCGHDIDERFEFVSLVKFNMLQNLVSSFYMTLLLRNRSTSEEKEFQVRIDERIYGSLYCACTVARFKDQVTLKSPFVPHFHDGEEIPELPDWPSDALVESQALTLDASHCRSAFFKWTYLYLKLVVCAHDRWISEEEVLSKLEIMSAVVIPFGMNVFDPCVPQALNMFIVFKGLAKGEDVAEIDENAECRAVVSRAFNKNGYMSLRGKLL